MINQNERTLIIAIALLTAEINNWDNSTHDNLSHGGCERWLGEDIWMYRGIVHIVLSLC